MCLQAFTWVRPKLKDLAYPRNIVHDSIIAECLPENVELVGKIIADEMVKSAQSIVGDYVRFAADITTGEHWGQLL
jgi:DNA polymerase I-like protein with 3'-5' exonuclease and polymerase domains